MTEDRFHEPTELERAFLRIVTLDYPESAAQIENCEVDDYDLTGYCDVRICSGTPSHAKNAMCDGPSLPAQPPCIPLVDTILWIDDSGYLRSIEVVVYGEPLDDVYQRFVKAASRAELQYHRG